MTKTIIRLIRLAVGFVLAVSGSILAFLVIGVCAARSEGGDHPSMWPLIAWAAVAALLWMAGIFVWFKGAE